MLAALCVAPLSLQAAEFKDVHYKVISDGEAHNLKLLNFLFLLRALL